MHPPSQAHGPFISSDCPRSVRTNPDLLNLRLIAVFQGGADRLRDADVLVHHAGRGARAHHLDGRPLRLVKAGRQAAPGDEAHRHLRHARRGQVLRVLLRGPHLHHPRQNVSAKHQLSVISEDLKHTVS